MLDVNKQSLKKQCSVFLFTTDCGFGSIEYEMLLTCLQCRMGKKKLLKRNLDSRNIHTSQQRSCEMTTVVVKVTLSIKLEVEFGQNINSSHVFCQLLKKSHCSSQWSEENMYVKERELITRHFLFVDTFNEQICHISLHAVLLQQESLVLKSFARGGCRTLQWWERS